MWLLFFYCRKVGVGVKVDETGICVTGVLITTRMQGMMSRARGDTMRTLLAEERNGDPSFS